MMLSIDRAADLRRQSLDFWRPVNRAAHNDNRPAVTGSTLRARARRRRWHRSLKEYTR
jgi:hypothetical protein